MSVQLWNGKRELEWQCEVSSVDKSSKKSGKSLYLFTDLCLYGSLKQKKFYVKHVIPLNELTLTPDPSEPHVELSFKKTKLIVAFDRAAERNKFVELTRDLSTPLKKKTMGMCDQFPFMVISMLTPGSVGSVATRHAGRRGATFSSDQRRAIFDVQMRRALAQEYVGTLLNKAIIH